LTAASARTSAEFRSRPIFFPKRKECLIGYHHESNDEFKIKVKVKFTLEQAMKAQRGR
jgi:hypothetical protein